MKPPAPVLLYKTIQSGETTVKFYFFEQVYFVFRFCYNTSIKIFQVLLISASRLLLNLFYPGLDPYMEHKESLLHSFFLQADKYSMCHVSTMKEENHFYTFVHYGHNPAYEMFDDSNVSILFTVKKRIISPPSFLLFNLMLVFFHF